MIKTNRPKKHSLTLKEHRTSVSLEDPFWYQFKKISAEKGIALNVLAAEIDDARGNDIGLASAIRRYILDHIISKK